MTSTQGRRPHAPTWGVVSARVCPSKETSTSMEGSLAVTDSEMPGSEEGRAEMVPWMCGCWPEWVFRGRCVTVTEESGPVVKG